jgi:hypothetical protein
MWFVCRALKTPVSHRSGACVARGFGFWAQKPAPSPIPQDKDVLASGGHVISTFIGIVAFGVAYTNVIQKLDMIESTFDRINVRFDRIEADNKQVLAEILQARLELSNLSGQVEILKGKSY